MDGTFRENVRILYRKATSSAFAGWFGGTQSLQEFSLWASAAAKPLHWPTKKDLGAAKPPRTPPSASLAKSERQEQWQLASSSVSSPGSWCAILSPACT